MRGAGAQRIAFSKTKFNHLIRQGFGRDFAQGSGRRSAYSRVAVGFFKASHQAGNDRSIIGRKVRRRISSLSGKYRADLLQSCAAQWHRPGAIGRDVEKYWQTSGTEIKHSNQCSHRRRLGPTICQAREFLRNLFRCWSKNSKSFRRPNSLEFRVVNQPVELPRQNAPDLPASALVLPLRALVTHPFAQPGQGVRSDVPDSIFSLRPAVIVSPGSGDFQPLTQLLPIIFGLVICRPKRNHANPHRNRRCQNDENSSPSRDRVSISFFHSKIKIQKSLFLFRRTTSSYQIVQSCTSFCHPSFCLSSPCFNQKSKIPRLLFALHERKFG